jgi:OFA family oxalate/formate antiporter-like MFS transporter|tara:strand:+ start:2871 stop:4118 length:1248 start_codon:yes stop_codon:yes gene_type:complete
MKNIFEQYRRWFVLAGLMLIYASSSGIIVHTLPLLYPPLIKEFGWSITQMTLPATVFAIFGAITSPPAGVLFDRFSVRRIMLVGTIGIILSLMSFAFISSLWHLVVVYLIFGLALSLCGLTASMVILTKWFYGKRGIATGLLLMSSSVGGAIFPLILGSGIETLGWRNAVMLVSVIAACMTLPAIIFLILDKPQKTDLNIKVKSIDQTPGLGLKGPTLRATIKTPTFYLVLIATGTIWFTVIALTQHQSLHLVTDVGIDSTLLPMVFSAFFGCSVIGKFSFGWLGDHLNKELSMIASISLLTVGLWLIRSLNADDVTMLFAYAVIGGIGFSGAFTTIQLLIAEHYAGDSYGKILALIVMIDSLAGGVGTRVMASMRDASGSYASGWDLLIALCLVAIVSTFLIKQLNHLKHEVAH